MFFGLVSWIINIRDLYVMWNVVNSGMSKAWSTNS
jgi:hypothetical protein